MWILIKNGAIGKVFSKRPSGDYEIDGKIYPRQIWRDNAFLASINIYPFTEVKPELSYGKKYGAPIDDVETRTRTYPVVDMPNLAEKETQEREMYKVMIDEAAARVRKYFAPYDLIDEEYARTFSLTSKWLEDTTQPVPSVVSAWAEASNMTNDEAAADIILKGNQYNQVLDGVRELRLKGKSAVSNCDGFAIEDTATNILDQLEAIIPDDSI